MAIFNMPAYSQENTFNYLVFSLHHWQCLTVCWPDWHLGLPWTVWTVAFILSSSLSLFVNKSKFVAIFYVIWGVLVRNFGSIPWKFDFDCTHLCNHTDSNCFTKWIFTRCLLKEAPNWNCLSCTWYEKMLWMC